MHGVDQGTAIPGSLVHNASLNVRRVTLENLRTVISIFVDGSQGIKSDSKMWWEKSSASYC
jgi:hypothetical protein